ncbi:MAG: polyphosphate kinase 2 family protein [Thermoplasmata archaeon]|nr:polyphosphate kinase 2 family protein [Thermoplasmata archaeon]MCI4355969.1 polyphosphate kinase 2 family protein [Thermoplasmata archaeon]
MANFYGQGCLVVPGTRTRLPRRDPRGTPGFSGVKDEGRKELARLTTKLEELQELLYAEHRHAVLVVLQGMDSAGKDGTIRRVFDGVNPQGVRVATFKRPSDDESDHDFLWRVSQQLPARGEMVLFNRSHYEDVLVPRVHHQIQRPVWERRYRAIREFERTLAEDGTVILKFFLHVSRGEQKRRLQARLDDPTKHWKFREADLEERRRWAAYMTAYEEALDQTSTSWAPWYVVPSDRKWFRDLFVASRIVAALARLRMHYPPLPSALRTAKVR